MGFCPSRTQNRAGSPLVRVDFKIVYRAKGNPHPNSIRDFQKNCVYKHQNLKLSAAKTAKWLDDYALYVALRQKTGKPWYEWLPSLRQREPKTLAQKAAMLAKTSSKKNSAQYLFFSQWRRLKEHCQKSGIKIVGDMPFYVAHDSADAWVHPELFSLHGNGKAAPSAAYHLTISAQLGSFGATQSTTGKGTKKQGSSGGWTGYATT